MNDACAAVRMYALWYPSLNPGATEAVANSGATIGGQFAVRVVVQPPYGSIITASVVEQSITEQTDVHPVSPRQLAGFDSVAPNPQYGDPTSNVVVFQSPFVNFVPHNGTYVLSVTVRYYVGPPPFYWGEFTETATMTLTMRNLVLVEAHEDAPYFKWNPAEMTGVTFSAQLQHAQQLTVFSGDSPYSRVKLEIFPSEDNQHPIFVKEFDRVPRPGSWSWTWDGKLPNGTVAPRGVYSYRLSAVTSVPTLPDSDSNRSDTLCITETKLEMQEGSLIFSYNLNEAAGQGFVLVFDPTPQEVIMYDAEVTSNPGWNHLQVSVAPSGEDTPPGYIRYLAMFYDLGRSTGRDKAHRDRWALPLNQRLPLIGVVIDVGHSGRQSDPGAVKSYGDPPKVIYECDLNLVLARLLGSELVTNHLTQTTCWLLEGPAGYTAAYTRSSPEDPAVTSTKKGRKERIRRIADHVELGFSCLVSIHHNSSDQPTQRRDIEVFYAPRNAHGSALAQTICDWLRVTLRPEVRPAQDNPKAGNFFFLYQHSYMEGKRQIGHQVPAALVEAGWMSNPEDLRELDPDNREGRERRLQTVLGIHFGLDEFFGQ